MKMVMQECLKRAKRAAIKRDWCRADEELRAMLLQATEDDHEAISSALLVLAADCEKLKLTEMALWAYRRVVQIARLFPTYAWQSIANVAGSIKRL